MDMKWMHLAFFVMGSALKILAAPGDIIAQWDFENPQTLNGKGTLTLRGNTTADARGLHVHGRAKDAPAGAQVLKVDAPLKLPSAFSVDMQFTLDTPVKPLRQVTVLLDGKYVFLPREPRHQKYHAGFMLCLRQWDSKRYSPFIALGYGKTSAQVYGQKITLQPHVRHSLRMMFTGTGRVRFSLDGKAAGDCHVTVGPLAPMIIPMTIGDRYGADHMPLSGIIHKVVLTEERYMPLVLASNRIQRNVFQRGESDNRYRLTLQNVGHDQQNLTLTATLGGTTFHRQLFPHIKCNDTVTIDLPLDLRLLPADYALDMSLKTETGQTVATLCKQITIVPARGDFMPLIMWGGLALSKAQKLGFTHVHSWVMPWRSRFNDADTPDIIADLDRGLRMGIYRYGNTDFRNLIADFPRRGRDGTPLARRNLEASNPRVQTIASELVARIARKRGFHPAWEGILLNSELRDGTDISFGGVEPDNFKKMAGFNIPKSVKGKYPLPWKIIRGFPWHRILPHNMPELVFYRWFWKQGDGWNTFQTLLSETLHREIKRPIFTWHDPAVRVPPLWGSGGKVDVISQWSYAYPDPLKVGQATDELIAMQRGNPSQKVMSMTQIICYRSQIAPKGTAVISPPEWLKSAPEAQFITIPPDMLREAFWYKLSRKVSGLMVHGVGSLCGTEGNYTFTNPKSQNVIADMSKRVIRPLGPILKRIPQYGTEVAILESFTSSLYAPQHVSNGWGTGWIADLHLALQWAGLQPGIIYEEDVLNLSFPQPKVIFLPGVEVLTDKVLGRLQELQSQGVLLIGDEFTTPALMPDLRIQSLKRKTDDPQGTKAALQALGRTVVTQLSSHYRPPVRTSNPDLVVHRRGSTQADYVFIINDKRTYGTYVGQWKRVMEKGLPNSGTITVTHPALAAYNLVDHKPIPVQSTGKECSFDVTLAPGDGQLILLLNRSIGRLCLELENPCRGQRFSCSIHVQDQHGQRISALIPLHVTLTDAQGHLLPGSGYHAATDGQLALHEMAAPNMSPGTVTLNVTCLASGLTATTTAVVR